MARERSNRLEIGRIGAPHGLRGDVHASLHFAGSDALSRAARVTLILDAGPRELPLRLVRPHGRGIVVGFHGIEDRDAAAALRGARLEVERALLPPLADGEYYLVDLIGATAVGPEGRVGEVIGVAAHPSTPCLVVRLADGRVAELLLVEPWVTRVDAEAGLVELPTLDGLIV